jgi:hypothetical protein
MENVAHLDTWTTKGDDGFDRHGLVMALSDFLHIDTGKSIIFAGMQTSAPELESFILATYKDHGWMESHNEHFSGTGYDFIGTTNQHPVQVGWSHDAQLTLANCGGVHHNNWTNRNKVGKRVWGRDSDHGANSQCLTQRVLSFADRRSWQPVLLGTTKEALARGKNSSSNNENVEGRYVAMSSWTGGNVVLFSYRKSSGHRPAAHGLAAFVQAAVPSGMAASGPSHSLSKTIMITRFGSVKFVKSRTPLQKSVMTGIPVLPVYPSTAIGLTL